MDGLGSFKTFWDTSFKKDLSKLTSSLKGLTTGGKSKKETSTEHTPNTKTRQQQPGGMTRATHLVPDLHRVNPKLNVKIETIRSQPMASDMHIPLDVDDMNYIQATYKIEDLEPGESKQLGNSDMMCTACPHTGKISLHKKHE